MKGNEEPTVATLHPRKKPWPRSIAEPHSWRRTFKGFGESERGNVKELAMNPGKINPGADFAERVRLNQQELRLKNTPHDLV
jgi:hypothetical protein